MSRPLKELKQLITKHRPGAAQPAPDQVLDHKISVVSARCVAVGVSDQPAHEARHLMGDLTSDGIRVAMRSLDKIEEHLTNINLTVQNYNKVPAQVAALKSQHFSGEWGARQVNSFETELKKLTDLK